MEAVDGVVVAASTTRIPPPKNLLSLLEATTIAAATVGTGLKKITSNYQLLNCYFTVLYDRSNRETIISTFE